MALRTLGTTGTTALQCLAAWSRVLAADDLAAIGQAITEDGNFASVLGGYSAGVKAVLAQNANTHANTTLDSLSVVLGSPPLSQIRVGDLVLKADIPLGTFVVAMPTASSVTLSKAASGSNTQVAAFVRFCRPSLGADGQLVVPGRGVLKVLPGDIVAVDNTGWPVLVSAAAIAYTGSLWSLT